MESRRRAQLLGGRDFAFDTLENATPQPFATYYSRDRITGEIHSHRLPADGYSMNHYLKKGFRLSADELRTEAKTERPVTPEYQI